MTVIPIDFSPAAPLHRQIELALRERIERGELSPGDPLPSTRDMARQMGVHPLTLQKALRRLKNDGLIDRTPRRGTFVRGPVTVSPLALIFGPRLVEEMAHFHRAILRALETETARRWTPRVYDGLTKDVTRETSRRRVLSVLRRDCEVFDFRASIVVGLGDYVFDDVPHLQGLPYAWLAASSFQSDLAFDYAHFAHATAVYLAQRNRRRIAYLRTLSPWSWSRGDRRAFDAAAAEFGLDAPEIHDLDELCGSTHDEHAAYEGIAGLLRRWDRTEWPEGVVVSDDVTMRAVAMALLHSPSPHARKLDLVTWANDAVRFKYGLPVARYEIPVSDCAKRLIAILERRIDGKEPLAGQKLICGSIRDDERSSGSVKPGGVQ